MSVKVIKVEGTRDDSKLIINVLEDSLQEVPIFIINKDKELYKFIEELQIDDSYLYSLKTAREIEFNSIPVELWDKHLDCSIKGNILNLTELLELLDMEKFSWYQLILDTSDKTFVSDVMQTLIYLNVNIEVVMKKEKRDRETVNAFKKSFKLIKNSVGSAKHAIEAIDVIDELSMDKANVVNLLNEIEKELERARERDLSIAVMATKKAGKSVIVNSFLEEQYAPTSLELPTPNTCIYKKSRDNRIKLVYEEEEIYFNSPEEIYKYTYNEFKRVQNDAENACTIDDMEIHYTNGNSDFGAFTVIDTPGPNYAGANNIKDGENMHKKSAYQWIEKSDVILFLVNYSNYLTLDEEEFFKDIKTQFEKYDKFYSLVVVVNKLDEMYMSECENKSVVRFLDYIRSKLYSLGYRGFVVFGTSARTYFDSLKVLRIDESEKEIQSGAGGISSIKGGALRERIKKLKRKYIGKGQMTVLSFVDDQLEKLECFHGIEDVSIGELKEKSGIPKLMEYTNYVAIQKANTELYASIIRGIDEKFVRLRNMDLIKSLIDSKIEKQDQMQEIEEMLERMISSLELIESEINEKLSFRRLQKDFSQQIRESREEKIESLYEIYESRIDNFFMKLRLKESDELKEIKTSGLSINLKINSKGTEEELNKLIADFLRQTHEDLDQKERAFREFDIRIKEIVHLFSEKIKKEYDLKDFEITVPKVEHAFSRRSLVKIPQVDISNINIEDEIIESIDFNENVIEKFINQFVENKLGTYSMDSKRLRDIKNNWMGLIMESIKKEFVRSYSILEGNLLGCIDELKGQIDKSIDNLTNSYKDIFNEILRDLSVSKLDVEEQMKYLDAKLQLLKKIEEKASAFTEVWSEIRMEAV